MGSQAIAASIAFAAAVIVAVLGYFLTKESSNESRWQACEYCLC
jgi:uncharacterized membrane protein